ncbi:carbon-nitrogen hydrolase family protein [Streptomyces sp. CA-294286]|uniref:carbon-nitrogen hydrolase family protein n=1 Tax=Streptomyces sp. CA-294286 TaxID=3240070 RepID=UPI003D94FEE6
MRLAVCQFTSRPLDTAGNLATMSQCLRDAGAAGARVVVFAELAVSGYELEALAADPGLWMTGPQDARLRPVRDACRDAGAAAVVNCAAQGRLMTYVYGPDGDLLTVYAKQHLHAGEDEVFAAGGEDGRFELDGVRFALATCFDNHFPDLAARAAADNCRAYLASSLYGTGGGERELSTVYPALAQDHGLYVAVANHVGRAGPYDGCGRSAVWGPDGVLLGEAPPGTPGIACGDVARSGEPPLR